MKFNEVEFKKEVAKLYNGEIKIVSKYKRFTTYNIRKYKI